VFAVVLVNRVRVLTGSLLFAGLFLAGPAGSAATESAWVKADAGLTGVHIRASMAVKSDAATLWATLTDYNRLTEFVPSLTISRVVSAPGKPKRVEQRADSGVFSFVMPDHVVLAMEEAPPDRIRFRAVSGSVVAMAGEWRILGTTNPVRLTYRSHVIPMVPPPPLLTDGFIEDEVRKRFEAVAMEAERRSSVRPLSPYQSTLPVTPSTNPYLLR
jgi:hypothetical protein